MKRMLRDEDQRYTEEGLRLDNRLVREFEIAMLREVDDGASLNEVELIMIRAVMEAAMSVRLDYEKHVAHQAAQITRIR